MDISKKDMEEYHRRLSQIQEKSKSTFNRLVEAGLKANPAMDDEEFLTLVEKSMVSTTLSFGDAAGSVALDFFTDTTGFSANNSDMAKLPFGVNNSFSDHVKEYAKNNDIKGEQFLEACGNLVESETLQQANRTIGKAGKKNGLKFARVPQGGECPFCAMLASLGFYYTESAANAHYHDHCKCKVVAGKPGTRVGGYDHTKTEKSFNAILENLGINKSLAEVRFDKDLRSKVLAEASRRNKDWLYRGEVTKPWYIKPREKLSTEEKLAIDILSSMGFSPVSLPEDAPRHVKNIDFWLRGQHLFVEHKNAGGGKHSIENNLQSARDKWVSLNCSQPRIVILTTEGSTRTLEHDIKEIIKRKKYYDEVWYVPPGGTNFLIIKNEG